MNDSTIKLNAQSLGQQIVQVHQVLSQTVKLNSLGFDLSAYLGYKGVCRHTGQKLDFGILWMLKPCVAFTDLGESLWRNFGLPHGWKSVDFYFDH